MAITNQQTVNQVQGLFPAVGPNPTDAGGLFRLANDGNRNATIKLAAGEGGADFLCTALTTAADTVTHLIPFASLLKLYAAQQANVTMLCIRVKSWVAAAAVANSQYTETVFNVQDVAGTMTQTAAPVAVAQIGTTATAISASGANLSIAVSETGAVAHQCRAEVFVVHVQ